MEIEFSENMAMRQDKFRLFHWEKPGPDDRTLAKGTIQMHRVEEPESTLGLCRTAYTVKFKISKHIEPELESSMIFQELMNAAITLEADQLWPDRPF